MTSDMVRSSGRAILVTGQSIRAPCPGHGIDLHEEPGQAAAIPR